MNEGLAVVLCSKRIVMVGKKILQMLSVNSAFNLQLSATSCSSIAGHVIVARFLNPFSLWNAQTSLVRQQSSLQPCTLTLPLDESSSSPGIFFLYKWYRPRTVAFRFWAASTLHGEDQFLTVLSVVCSKCLTVNMTDVMPEVFTLQASTSTILFLKFLLW